MRTHLTLLVASLGDYCKALIAAARVAAVPMDCFYFAASPAAPRSLVRFALCKRTDTIDAAAAAIRAAPVPLARARAAA
jgi:aspartate/methionine/tyrosine aminotransferase